MIRCSLFGHRWGLGRRNTECQRCGLVTARRIGNIIVMPTNASPDFDITEHMGGLPR